MLLNAQDLSYFRADKKILGPLSHTFAEGQTTVLLGPSGCGKTTLLRLLLGLIWPHTGSVYIDGKPLDPKNIRWMRRAIGYVTQDGGLFPHLKVIDNLLLSARAFREVPKAYAQLEYLLPMTQLDPQLLHRYPAELSGGQRQRVSLLRALMLDPPLVLLDEPMGALDPMIRLDLQSDLKRIFSDLKKTVVLVTHDVAEAAFFADSLVLLNEGTIVQTGRFEEFILDPKQDFVRAFFAAHRTLPIPQGASLKERLTPC